MRTPLSAVFLVCDGRTLVAPAGDDVRIGGGGSVLWEACAVGRMGNDGRGGARLRCLLAPGAAPEAAPVGVCRPPLFTAAAAAMGFGGSEGCPGREPVADVAEAPSSCRNLASIRAILASVLLQGAMRPPSQTSV